MTRAARFVVAAVAFAIALTACSTSPTNPDSWLSDEFRQRLPEDSRAAFSAHVRAAVAQEFDGVLTFVGTYDDAQLLELAVVWCDDGASRFSDVIGDELDARGVEVEPERPNFLPPPPIDEIITRVAALHDPPLCKDLATDDD